MTSRELVGAVAQLSGITFVVASMSAMGMGFTVSMILAPLRR